MVSITPFTMIALLLFGGLMVVPFVSLPPLRYGYYLQIEGVISGFWAIGGLAGIWAFWLSWKKPNLAKKIWSLPIVWGWMPILTLSIIQSLFLPIPLQSWTGFGQLGEGIITFFCQMFIMFILCILTRIYQVRFLVLWVTFFSGALLSFLSIIGGMHSPIISMRYWSWAPIFFPDFVAYISAAFMGMYMIFCRRYKYNLFFHGIFLSTISVMSYYSYNTSIYYAFLIGLIIIILLEIPFLKKIPYNIKFSFFFISALVSLTAFIIFYEFISPYLPSFLSLLETIIGRTHLTKITFLDLLPYLNEWKIIWAIIFGKGWGEYGNSLLSNLFLLKEMYLFNGQSWQHAGEFTQRDMLHSHNIITEHFLALGVIGVSIFLWTKYRIILSMKWINRYAGIIFLTVSGIISVFWFPVIHTFPYLLTTSALIFTRVQPIKFFTYSRFKIISGIMGPIIFIFTLIHTGFIIKQGDDASIDPSRDIIEVIEQFSNSSANHYEALVGGRRWIAYTRSYTQSINNMLNAVKDADVDVFANWSRKLALNIYNTIPHAGNLYSVLLPMNIYGELATQPATQKWFESHPQLIQEWNDIGHNFIKYLPFRSDILIPYLNYLMMHQREHLALEFIEKILEQAPKDPIALWFKGSILLIKGQNPTLGICLLKKAVKEKINRYMPLLPADIKRIQERVVICPIDEG